jgi:WD40 repeat protein
MGFDSHNPIFLPEPGNFASLPACKPSYGIEVRDAKTGKLMKAVNVDGQRLWGFELSSNRKWVAVVISPDPTTRPLPSGPEADVAVLDTVTWKVRGTIGGSRRLLALAADGRTVLVSHKGQVEVWDVVEKKRLRAAPFEFKRIDAAALSPDGSLAAVSGLNEIAYWKWRDRGGDKFDRIKLGRKVVAVAFSPDGKRVAEGPEVRMTVEVRDVVTLKVAQSLSDPAQPRVPLTVAGMTFADSGKRLVFGKRGKPDRDDPSASPDSRLGREERKAELADRPEGRLPIFAGRVAGWQSLGGHDRG